MKHSGSRNMIYDKHNVFLDWLDLKKSLQMPFQKYWLEKQIPVYTRQRLIYLNSTYTKLSAKITDVFYSWNKLNKRQWPCQIMTLNSIQHLRGVKVVRE